jgi:hypothetical protein
MMFLQSDFGRDTTRESAIAAACLRAQGHASRVAMLPVCPSANGNRSRPGP